MKISFVTHCTRTRMAVRNQHIFCSSEADNQLVAHLVLLPPGYIHSEGKSPCTTFREMDRVEEKRE